MSQFGLFHKIDSAIFTQIEKIKNNANYQQISSKYESLPTSNRKLVNKLLVITVLGMPSLVVMTIFIMNLSLKNKISINQQILDRSELVLSKQKEVNLLNETIIGASGPISSENELSSKVQLILSRNNAAQIKNQITQFEKSDLGQISKTTATIVLPDVGLVELNAVVTSLINQEKMNITGINIKKNKESGTLSASVSVNKLAKPL